MCTYERVYYNSPIGELNARRTSAFNTILNQKNEKTKLCRLFPKCPYGNKCSFAHGNGELRKLLCAFGVTCKRVQCPYDHSVEIIPPIAITPSIPSFSEKKTAVNPEFIINIESDNESDSDDDDDNEKNDYPIAPHNSPMIPIPVKNGNHISTFLLSQDIKMLQVCDQSMEMARKWGEQNKKHQNKHPSQNPTPPTITQYVHREQLNREKFANSMHAPLIQMMVSPAMLACLKANGFI